MSLSRAPASGGAHRYEALDSLRGICACFVVLMHLDTTGVITNLAIVRHGGLFVDFFFVLSGFVIAASYGDKLEAGFPLRAYMVLRLGRIYPLHLFMLLVFVGLETAMFLLDVRGGSGRPPFTGEHSLPFLVADLLLIQIFIPDAKFSWNSPSWSIAAEIWTYGLTAIGLSLLGRRFRLVLCAIAILAPVALVLLGDRFLTSHGWSLVRCLFGFSLGMLAFDFRALWRRTLGRGAATLAEAAILSLSAAAITWLAGGPLQFVCPLLFALAILVLAREEGAASDVLKRAPLRRLGTWSYSIYMVHALVLALVLNILGAFTSWLGKPLITYGVLAGRPFREVGGGGIVPDAVTLICLALVIIVASITYRLVERPCRDASRQWAERLARRPVADAERVAPTM